MATTPTTKLGIPLPVAGSGEPFTVAAYNFGINALDGAAGFTVCTSATRPVSPWLGQAIFETDTELSFIWKGSAWMPGGGGGSIEISATAPAGPGEGDLWWDSDNGKLYIYYNDGTSSQWVDAAGPSVAVQSTAPTGYEGQLWLDSDDGSMYVYYTDPGGGSSSWIGAVSRSGGILQVVQAVKTDTFSTTSTSFTAVTGASVSITPRSTSSKILILGTTFIGFSGSTNSRSAFVRVTGGNSVSYVGDAAGSRIRAFGTTGARATDYGINTVNGFASLSYVDSPSTTSTVTYQLEMMVTGDTGYIGRTGTDTDATGFGRFPTTLIVMEVAG
jgi:hypothetical protein